MSAHVFSGWHRTWGGSRDDEGHRTFTVKHLVQVSNPQLDGPATVMFANGLPAIGSFWQFGGEIDVWAFCWPTMTVKIHEEREGEVGEFWEVDQKFSTKPIPSKRCQDNPIEDPMLEPMKISGSFIRTTEEAIYDRFGNFLQSSSYERFKGPLVEFDVSKPTVKIEQNVLSLDLPTFSSMVDCVNDSPLWGLPSRCVKLSTPEWTREIYGSCSFYYKRVFNFDIDYNTFDRDIPDAGTKALHGEWDVATGRWKLLTIGGSQPDPGNPQHYSQYTDRNANPGSVLLNGSGLPAGAILGAGTGSGDDTGPGYIWRVQKYPSVNFLLLGIPTVL